MTAQEIQEAFNSIFKDLGRLDTVEVYEVEGGIKFRIISEAFNWDLEDYISFFLFDDPPYSLKGEESKELRTIDRSDDEIRSYVLTLSPEIQEAWENESWDKTQNHFRENGFTVYVVAGTFSRAKLEETLERHHKDPQEVVRHLAAEEAKFERKRLVSQAEDFVGEYENLSEPCRDLVREMIVQGSAWEWPLKSTGRTWPDGAGQFGVVRKHDTHTGVDLYVPAGTEVVAVEDGTVVAIEAFTGPSAGSPWWNETKAILVEGKSGVVCYGEMVAYPEIEVGMSVGCGYPLGTVLTVLKKDKGRPMTMLHIELYEAGVTKSVWWVRGDRPSGLLDPTEHLKGAFFNGLERKSQI